MSEALDSWQKFLDLHAAVMTWSREKNEFVSAPIHTFESLPHAKSRLQEYANNTKSVKYAGKNLSEMQRELGVVAGVASTADLPEKLAEAEHAKVETETQLYEKVRSDENVLLIYVSHIAHDYLDFIELWRFFHYVKLGFEST